MENETKETRICEQCGKEYTPKQPRVYWQKFCSNACKQKAKRAREKAQKAQ